MNELTPISSPESSRQLQVWAAAARDALAGNTQRAYASDSKAFADWCRAESINALPASPEAVAAFLRAQAGAGRAVATIRRRAATIAKMHKAAGLPNPCAHELVKLTLKGIARGRGTDQRQAAALTERDTVTIRARLGDTARDVRNLALLLAGRDLLARASELVAITVADLEGEVVRIRRRKTSTETQTCFLGPEAQTALQAWLARAGITQGPVFQSLTKAGTPTGRALSTRDVRRILKGLAETGRLEHSARVSGHSLRVGMAQDLVAADMDVASVMQAGGWSTPRMVARYTENLSAQRGAVARYYGRR